MTSLLLDGLIPRSGNLAKGVMKATFCFIDLEGFTALTEAHGDQAAANLVERFAALVEASLERTGRLVKTIGDAALVMIAEPAQAVDFMRRVCEAAGAEPTLPLLRAGLHAGDAVERRGDVFGSAVNIAARVTGMREAGRCSRPRSWPTLPGSGPSKLQTSG